MKLTYDPDADAAYLYFASPEPEVARTFPVTCPPSRASLNLDFDEDGHIVGIEVVGARELLPASVLAKAEREPAPPPRPVRRFLGLIT